MLNKLFLKKLYSGFRNRYCYETDIEPWDSLRKIIMIIDEGSFLLIPSISKCQ